MRVALLSANLGGFDSPVEYATQLLDDGVEMTIHRVTDKEFPRRIHAMTARMQMGAVKRFCWEWVPDHDVYIWLDASVTLTKPHSVMWFLRILGQADLALLPHPQRRTIHEEAEFLRAKIADRDPYLTSRYEFERLDAQLAAIDVPGFRDQKLYATTTFAFRDSPKVRGMFKEWWYHVSKYHALDQLSFPFVVAQSGCVVRELPGNLYKHPELVYTRHGAKSDRVNT